MKQIKYLLLLAVIFMADSIFAQNANQARTCLDKATAIVANQGESPPVSPSPDRAL